jgi:hypothetical protein
MWEFPISRNAVKLLQLREYALFLYNTMKIFPVQKHTTLRLRRALQGPLTILALFVLSGGSAFLLGIKSAQQGTAISVTQAQEVPGKQRADPLTVLLKRDRDLRGVLGEALSLFDALPITAQLVGSGGPPYFDGRLEAVPDTVRLGEDVTFFIGIGDQDGTDTIKQVTIDLVDLGDSVVEMRAAVSPPPQSIHPVIYTLTYTVPVDTVPGRYSLEVRALDKDGNLARTTIPLVVSATVQRGSVPVITRLFATPDVVPPDERTDVRFTVEVEDGDGIEDIQQVRMNLAPLQLGIITLSPQLVGTGRRVTRGIFTSAVVRIPTTVKPAGYDLLVEVEDQQGNLTRDTLRITVGKGSLGGSAPQLRESRFIPDTARPKGKTRLFIEVRDENGTETVTVFADFTPLRGTVESLQPLLTFASGTRATQNTFASSDFTIPEDLPPGIYDIPVTVLDDAGNEVQGGARLRVERFVEEEGQAPRIEATRSFQTPRVFVNDDKTTGELHVLVHDPDDDVLTVVVNLGTIGRATSAGVGEGGGDVALLCNAARSLACMQRSVPEGPTARWFVLRDIFIPPITLPGSDPYELDVTAIDERGHIDQAQIPVRIGGAETETRLKSSPHILGIVPVDEDELEVIMSAPLDTRTADRRGSQFLIQPTLRGLSSLHVARVAWDTTARFLYLQTDPLTAGETYTLLVLAAPGGVPPLTDIYGNRFSRDSGGSFVFKGYQPLRKAPAITGVDVVDPTHIDVHFTTQILPSSVHPDLLPFRVHLTSVLTAQDLPVLSGELRDEARTLRLELPRLREGDYYKLRITGLLAPGLLEAPTPGLVTSFIAVFPTEEELGPIILPTPDLNRDGLVDFNDFTLFSVVYNTEYDLEAAESKPPSPDRPPTTPRGPAEQVFGGELPNLEMEGKPLPRIDR